MYPPTSMIPVYSAFMLMKRKPSQVWSWAPSSKLRAPKGPLPPPSRVTPPTVSALTVIGRVRLANRSPPIHRESDLFCPDGLTWYVPLATTISSTVLSARVVSSAGIDVTRTDLPPGVGVGVGLRLVNRPLAPYTAATP